MLKSLDVCRHHSHYTVEYILATYIDNIIIWNNTVLQNSRNYVAQYTFISQYIDSNQLETKFILLRKWTCLALNKFRKSRNNSSSIFKNKYHSHTRLKYLKNLGIRYTEIYSLKQHICNDHFLFVYDNKKLYIGYSAHQFGNNVWMSVNLWTGQFLLIILLPYLR